jgi:CheY-like chemotaxis protein
VPAGASRAVVLRTARALGAALAHQHRERIRLSPSAACSVRELEKEARMTLHTSPVLLIDDHDDVREGLRMILQREGWVVEATSDPRVALNKLVGGLQPCIILMDLMSSTMNGAEFHRELTSVPQFRNIPMVAYSGLKNVRAKARQAAGDSASDLPGELERLLAAVRNHCPA